MNLHESGLSDFYVYQHSELAKRAQAVYSAYLSKPKKDGTTKKEVGFRWFDEVSFTEDDKARKNNWNPIENALHAA